jgi:hypothetical protein
VDAPPVGDQNNRGGMPMMPPMSPGGAGNNQAAERPDSAGLLEAGKEPWESEAPDLGEPEAPQGTLPGSTAAEMSPVDIPAELAEPDVEPLGFVPPVPGPQGWSPGATTPANGTRPGGPPVMPPGTGNPKDQTPERPDSSGLLETTGTPWENDGPDLGEPAAPQGAETRQAADWAAPAETPVQPASEPEAELAEEMPEDWVPVVRRDDGEQDTSAWDVPGGGLPWLVPFPVSTRPEEEERDRPAPDYALRDTRPWEPEDSGAADWKNAKWAEGDTLVDEEEEQPILCGGPAGASADIEAEEERARAEAEQAEADEEEEDEEKERTAADLLVRDTSAWGDKPAGPPSGVIG